MWGHQDATDVWWRGWHSGWADSQSAAGTNSTGRPSNSSSKCMMLPLSCYQFSRCPHNKHSAAHSEGWIRGVFGELKVWSILCISHWIAHIVFYFSALQQQCIAHEIWVLGFIVSRGHSIENLQPLVEYMANCVFHCQAYIHHCFCHNAIIMSFFCFTWNGPIMKIHVQ